MRLVKDKYEHGYSFLLFVTKRRKTKRRKEYPHHKKSLQLSKEDKLYPYKLQCVLKACNKVCMSMDKYEHGYFFLHNLLPGKIKLPEVGLEDIPGSESFSVLCLPISSILDLLTLDRKGSGLWNPE